MPEITSKSKKKYIHEVAGSLFRQQGYPATSMRQIAAGLGIEAGSVYSYIKSKEEILQAICFEMASEFFRLIKPVFEKETDSENRLRSAIIAHVKVITGNIDAAAVFFHDWRHLSEPYLSDFKEQRLKYESWFRKIIKDGMEDGSFRPGDEKLTSLTILSALNWTYEWYKPEGKMSSDEIADNLADILIKGLRKN
jgi:AcrR family transcriptional regulator